MISASNDFESFCLYCVINPSSNVCICIVYFFSLYILFIHLFGNAFGNACMCNAL